MPKPVTALLAGETEDGDTFFISLFQVGIKTVYLDYVKVGLLSSVMFFFHVTRHCLP